MKSPNLNEFSSNLNKSTQNVMPKFSSNSSQIKRNLGQYFTTYNPFKNAGFLEWARKCKLAQSTILEPFAGSNNLITMLKEMNLCHDFKSFDIEPKSAKVAKKDTLKDFPKGFKICITNPPYLAQNSATRRGLDFPHTKYDDLYKFALEICLKNCDFVGAIVPASFFNAQLFRERLSCYILLNSKMFNDTEHPVCLALFVPNAENTAIYHGEKFLGFLSEFEQKLPKMSQNQNIKFNETNGNLGLLALDNTKEASIKFINGNEISPNKIRVSSRSITRILVPNVSNLENLITKLNENLNQFRKGTHDLFLTPFKGLRKDGFYRRRLDYKLAKMLIIEALNEL